MTVETAQVSGRLLKLQTIDDGIRKARDRVAAFEPMIEAVDEPVRTLKEDVDVAFKRVRELRMEERRLELAAEEKRARVARLQERLNLVRTLREEAAVQAELGLVRRALDQEELELVSLLDQMERFEKTLDAKRKALEDARAVVEPRRDEIRGEQEHARAELASLQLERDLFAASIDRRYLSAYDNLVRSGRRSAVTHMTANGACGVCFSLIPLQLQNEIRTTAPLIRCEACGVIVTAMAPADAGGSPSAEQADDK